MDTLAEQAQKRGCYCSVWDKDPKVYEDLGYERGYCGTCDRCGKPGHTRHFPGAAPFTGSWCDKHYRMTMWLHPQGAFGCFVWILAVLATVGLWLLFR